MASDKPAAEQSKWLITQQRRGDGKTSEELYREMEEYGVVPPDDLGYSYLKDTNGDIWT
jgi:pentatricopeptide repeat protein